MDFEIETPLAYDIHSSMPSIPSNISSSPSNYVIHFDAQVSLFKPSKRFFCNNDLTSPLMEEEELEESESEEEQAEEEEELEESESEEELSDEELSDEEESEDEDSEEEDVGSGDGNLTSNSENSEPNTSSVPSDCVIHFGTQMSLFKPSKGFF